MSRTLNTQSLSKFRGSERQELDVQLPATLAIAFGLAVLIYAALFPLRTSALGILLYERGLTQYAVIFLACTVATFTLIKFVKLQGELRVLRQGCIPRDLSLQDPTAESVDILRRNLSLSGSLIALRCSRVLAAYIHSGNRQAAGELALDDSSFYQAASEASYSFPRILIWAIPLLGFIGTVIGISSAVAGFSGFLEDAGNIDQIKEGIGQVTSGLAIAFDTTLLALLLSVVVMIPLVLVERSESRLLLAIDVYINDKLLPRLRETSANLDESTLKNVVGQAFQTHLPSHEALIQPAEEYAKQAAAKLSQGFIAEISQIQGTTITLIEQIEKLNQSAWQERQNFQEALQQQQQTSTTAFANLVSELQETNLRLLEEFKSGNSTMAEGLFTQAENLSNQLEKAAAALQDRVTNLEKYSAQVAEIAQLQQTLDQTLHSLEKSAHLEEVLMKVQENLGQLKPVLEKLNRPRRITFVENEND